MLAVKIVRAKDGLTIIDDLDHRHALNGAPWARTVSGIYQNARPRQVTAWLAASFQVLRLGMRLDGILEAARL